MKSFETEIETIEWEVPVLYNTPQQKRTTDLTILDFRWWVSNTRHINWCIIKVEFLGGRYKLL